MISMLDSPFLSSSESASASVKVWMAHYVHYCWRCVPVNDSNASQNCWRTRWPHNALILKAKEIQFMIAFLLQHRMYAGAGKSCNVICGLESLHNFGLDIWASHNVLLDKFLQANIANVGPGEILGTCQCTLWHSATNNTGSPHGGCRTSKWMAKWAIHQQMCSMSWTVLEFLQNPAAM